MDKSDSDTFFVRSILGIPPESTTPMFLAFQLLSLSNVSFQSGKKGLLSSLTLRFCYGWENFLRRGCRLSRPTRLKSSDIQSTLSHDIDAENSISRFLGSFQGLEQMAIFTGSPSWILDIWRAALHQQTTLRAFTHHQRGIDEDEDYPYLREDCESSDLSLSLYDKDMAKWAKNLSKHPWNNMDLEFVGLCCHPELLV